MKPAVLSLILAAAALAGSPPPLALPKPQTQGGKPLMEVLQQRQSGRDFSEQKLSPQVLSNLLWAAFGVNRPDGRRTAPSASNRQEIDIYVVTGDGAYLYNAKAQRLDPVESGDLRAATGGQAFVTQAALNLVYVADYARMSGAADEKAFYSAADTGFIGQNVYLFCASEGLATVIRGGIDRAALAKTLGLRPEQKVVLSQTVGYPRRAAR